MAIHDSTTAPPAPHDPIRPEALGWVAPALVYAIPPRKLAKIAKRWRAAADRYENDASRRAGVYSIRDRGKLYGERPADIERLEAAALLRTFAAFADRVGGK